MPTSRITTTGKGGATVVYDKKRVEVEHMLEMERCQKRRLEEIWETQKEEKTMDMKE